MSHASAPVPHPGQRKAYAVLALGVFAIGWSALFVRWTELPGWTSAFWRMALAQLVFVPWALASRPAGVARPNRSATRDAVIAGVPGRVFRISFSGELAFELNVATPDGLAVWEAVMAAGAPYDITPYGTESMHVLRAEKGYPIIGQETDGTVTPQDLGMDGLVSKKKSFMGQRSHRRPDAIRPDRKHLVGLLPIDPDALLPEGAQLVAPDADLSARPVPMLGHVTSSYRSAALGRTFALALVKGGRDRLGERVLAPLAGAHGIEAVITSSVLFDPENRRRDGETA